MRKRYTGTLVVITAIAMVTSCAEIDARREIPVGPATAVGLTMFVHGVGASPGMWPSWLDGTVRRTGLGAGSWHIIRLDWRDISEKAVTSAGRGYRLGKGMGEALAASGTAYELLHLVSHSMGAHVIQGVADAYRQVNPDSAIHLTFLDPFVMRGPFMPLFGRRVFGRNSDFAECYVTRTGSLFPTNVLVTRAHNFDLSDNIPPDRSDDRHHAHLWPYYYYLGVESGEMPGTSLSPYATIDPGDLVLSLDSFYSELHATYPRGETTSVK